MNFVIYRYFCNLSFHNLSRVHMDACANFQPYKALDKIKIQLTIIFSTPFRFYYPDLSLHKEGNQEDCKFYL